MAVAMAMAIAQSPGRVPEPEAIAQLSVAQTQIIDPEAWRRCLSLSPSLSLSRSLSLSLALVFVVDTKSLDDIDIGDNSLQS